MSHASRAPGIQRSAWRLFKHLGAGGSRPTLSLDVDSVHSHEEKRRHREKCCGAWSRASPDAGDRAGGRVKRHMDTKMSLSVFSDVHISEATLAKNVLVNLYVHCGR